MAIAVQGRRAHPGDSPHLLGFDCPACGLRQGVYAAGEVRCRCGALLAVAGYDGYAPAAAFDLAAEQKANAALAAKIELLTEGEK